MSSRRTVGELADALEQRFPGAWADEWDNVGLIIGSRESEIRGVLITLDATAEAVERAARSGANVVLTHHPPFLQLPDALRAEGGPAGTLEAALRLGVAVISLHTNLDRSPEGATELATVLDLAILSAVETTPERVMLVVTYAPADAETSLREAMGRAGAGRLGEYEECAFTSRGTGHFEPMAGAHPIVEDSGDGVAEVRIEMVTPPSALSAVLEAARAAHPYEEPVVIAAEGVRARGAARMGRLCTWREHATLGELAAHVSATLGCSCRIWGAEAKPVGRIVVGNGSGGSLIPQAARTADTLLVGEVRYHDALTAVAAGLGIIEAGHDSTEWPLVRILEAAVREWDPGVPLEADSASLGWWTMEGANVRR